MELTRKTLIGNGSTTLYNVNFNLGYIDTDYVFVYLDGNEKENQLQYVWRNSNQIELNQPVEDGVKFYIRRVIPRDMLVNNYSNGALLRETNLNNSYLQTLMILEEIQDGFITTDDEFFILAGLLAGEDLNMNGHRILNLPKPSRPDEPIRLGDLSNGFTLLAEPYEVPPFSGSTFSLPDESTFVQIEVNGRVLPPSMFTIGLDKRTITLRVPVDEEDNVVTRYTLLTEGKAFPIKTPYDFGAIGDGVIDDTIAIKDWINYSGGIRYGASGVFLVSEEIICDSNTVIVGSGSGSGTVGEQDNESQVSKGAFILKAAAEFTGEAVLKFKDDESSALYSCSLGSIKFDMLGSDVHAMVFEKAYDNLNVHDVNVMNLGDNSSAIIIRGNNDIPSNSISQTIVLTNIMGIHERGTATAPTMYFESCQEMTLTGVKAFGGFQVNLPTCYPMHFRDCRGVNLVGCSQAHTRKAGILVDSVTRSSDGISILGNTFENCLEGGLKVRGAEAPNNIARVNVTNPRYQFPQSIAFDIDGADGCTIDAAARTGILGSRTNQNEIKASIQSSIEDNGYRNTIISPPSGASAERTVNTNLGSEGYLVGKQLYARSNSSPILQYLVGSLTYTTKFESTKNGQVETLGNVSYTFSNGATMEHQKSGNLRLTGTPSNRRTSLILDDANGVPWAFRFDTTGVPAMINQNDGTVVGFTGVLPLADGTSATVIRGVITKVV